MALKMAESGNNDAIGLLKHEGRGWKIDLFVDENVKQEYVCHYCQNICCEAVELSCVDNDIEHDDEDLHLYCKTCLISVISSNNNLCPINNHKNPKYSSIRRLRSKINKSKVFCPNSLEYLKEKRSNIAKGNKVIDTMDEKEGRLQDNNNNKAMEGNCKFNGLLCDLIKHIPKCCEENLGSKQVQTHIIKLLKTDIKNLKSENKQIENTLIIQNEIINQLKKENVNVNERIVKLKKENVNVNAKYGRQNERIVKLENIIKSMYSFEHFDEKQKEQILIRNNKKKLTWQTKKHGKNLTFIHGNIVKKMYEDDYAICLFGEEITNQMCNQFNIEVKIKKCGRDDGTVLCCIGYITSTPENSIKDWNRNSSIPRYMVSSNYGGYVKSCVNKSDAKFPYKPENTFKEGDTMKFSFNFPNNLLTIYHKDRIVGNEVILNNSKKITFAMSLYCKDDEYEITNYEFV